MKHQLPKVRETAEQRETGHIDGGLLSLSCGSLLRGCRQVPPSRSGVQCIWTPSFGRPSGGYCYCEEAPCPTLCVVTVKQNPDWWVRRDVVTSRLGEPIVGTGTAGGRGSLVLRLMVMLMVMVMASFSLYGVAQRVPAGLDAVRTRCAAGEAHEN